MKSKTFYCQWTLSQSPACKIQCNICKQKSIAMENELLNDIQKQTPAKFKFNIVGIYFVGSLVCVLWKIFDLLTYLINHL